MVVISIENVNLESIDASSNIRRACKRLANKGIDVWNMLLRYGLADDTKNNFEYIKSMIENEPELVRLALSIHKMGQINPIIARKFGPIYKVIAGQRRCLAVALLVSLHRILNFADEGTIDAVVEMLQEYEFSFSAIQENEEGFHMQVKVVDINDDDAERISFDENDQSMPISDLDWGYDFDKLTKTINPVTGKNYNMKEISAKRNKPYQFVVGRSALPYLPKDWQEKLDEGVLNITECITYAKELRDEQESGKAPVLGVAPSVIPIEESIPFYAVEEEKKEGEESSAPTKPWTAATRKPRSSKKKSSKDRMSREEILNLLATVDPSEKVAIGLIAQILWINSEDAEDVASGKEKIETYL